MNAVLAAIVRTFGFRRGERSVRVIDELPLFGGCALHVVEVDRRRLVFASSPGAICLLAQFEGETSAAVREEESWTSV